jgi:hypothetical protein
VTVGVVDDPAESEPWGNDPCFFPEFSSRGGPRGLAGLDLAAGEFPETPEQALGGAALYEPSSMMLEHDHGRFHAGRARPPSRGGERSGVR